MMLLRGFVLPSPSSAPNQSRLPRFQLLLPVSLLRTTVYHCLWQPYNTRDHSTVPHSPSPFRRGTMQFACLHFGRRANGRHLGLFAAAGATAYAGIYMSNLSNPVQRMHPCDALGGGHASAPSPDHHPPHTVRFPRLFSSFSIHTALAAPLPSTEKTSSVETSGLTRSDHVSSTSFSPSKFVTGVSLQDDTDTDAASTSSATYRGNFSSSTPLVPASSSPSSSSTSLSSPSTPHVDHPFITPIKCVDGSMVVPWMVSLQTPR